MINRVVLVGRLTRDPELKKTSSDVPFSLFTLAVDSASKTQTANFIPVIVWREQAVNVCKYIHKGSLIGVDGYLSQRSYDKLDGTKGYLIEVVASSVQFLEPKNTNKINISDEIDDKKDKIEVDSNVSEVDNNVNDKEEEFDNDEIDLKDEDLPF